MKTHSRWIARIAPIACFLILANIPAAAQTGAKNGEWTTYGGDLASTRYAPLDQINADNFNKLEVAWRFKTDSLGPRPEFQFESTPLMVHGVLYTTAGSRRDVVALDAATGELLWMHSENEGARGANAPRQLSGHGLAYWTDGNGRTHPVRHARLPAHCSGREDGHACSEFRQGWCSRSETGRRSGDRPCHGRSGTSFHACGCQECCDCRRGAPDRRSSQEQKERERLRPRIRRAHGQAPLDFPYHSAARRVRQRHLGEGFLAYTGNTGVWGQISVDEDLGLVYLPVELPTGDYFGGDRPGNGLFGESHRRRGSANGQAEMALPARAPRPLGHGHSLRADSG